MKIVALLAAIIALPTITSAETSVWADAPTGSLLGRGYSRTAKTTPASTGTLATRLANEDPALRNALLDLDRRSDTVLEGITLMPAAVQHQTKVPSKTLEQQMQATGMTYSELLVANSLAGGSGKSFEAIMAMKKNRSWTQMAKELQISPSSLVARAQAAGESLKFAASRREQRRLQNVRDNGFDKRSTNPQNAPGAGG